MTTKTKTVTTTYTAEPCTRYPCDHAYPKNRHTLGDDGRIHHSCSAGGSDSQGWRVALMALDDGPWRVAIELNDGNAYVIEDDGRYSDNPLMRAQNAIENAIDLAHAITTSVGRLAGTWLQTPDAEWESDADFWHGSRRSAR